MLRPIISHGSAVAIAVLIAVFLLINACESCELDQTQNGCRIDNGACNCAFGCKSEFRYATRKECQDALKGRSNDICSRSPCLNSGTCIQVTPMPGYKCRCESTGYWGNRCQRLCPTETELTSSNYPHECIII